MSRIPWRRTVDTPGNRREREDRTTWSGSIPRGFGMRGNGWHMTGKADFMEEPSSSTVVLDASRFRRWGYSLANFDTGPDGVNELPLHIIKIELRMNLMQRWLELCTKPSKIPVKRAAKPEHEVSRVT